MEIKDFHLATFSNPYYDFLDNFAQSEYESAKLLGKFYTDYIVAEEMIGVNIPSYGVAAPGWNTVREPVMQTPFKSQNFKTSRSEP